MINKKLVREVVRFGLVGGSGLVANILLLMLLVEIVSIPEYIAAIISQLTVLLGSFVATNSWVFETSQTQNTGNLLKRGVGYYAIMLCAKGVNYILYIGLISMNVWYPVAWIIGSVIVFVGTFSMNRLMWNRI